MNDTSRPLSKKEAKEYFLSHFSDQELRKIYALLARSPLASADGARYYLILSSSKSSNHLRQNFPSIDHRELYSFAGLDIKNTFQFFTLTELEQLVAKIKEALPKINALEEERETRWQKLLELPERLMISNSLVGEVVVTRHAWQRFCKRWRIPGQRGKPWFVTREYFSNKLRESFARSLINEIGDWHRFWRLLSNHAEPAIYLLDDVSRLRFVVSERSPRILYTVERPKR